ncbi:MAG TPA: sulfatase-like hydrolase/transferase [Solirubrobacteraceae bacterium]|jgi:arylsulfatase A-like enzyme|nr:sulfatase-like hydrolase/transferase [Solirubrobacteraceae bacterium]
MRADEDKKIDKRIDRRTFVKKGLIAGGAVAGGALAVSRLADATDVLGAGASAGPASVPAPAQPIRRQTPASPQQPNILVIVVDQLRFPQWLGVGPGGPDLPPNLRRLRRGAVSFARHYTASNDCTPARATLLTGLYTHQTGCMITGGSTLDPGFPTWGSMLREHGYHTRWYGKWHLTHGDNNWDPARGSRSLERYGFAGGTYPSPDGAPGQGWRVDPGIAGQFEQWLSTVGESEPWCTTVSFVNPHDIAWWYGWSDRVPAEAHAPSVIGALPPNFETPELLAARNKPRLQHSLQETAAASFGPVPFTGPEVTSTWLGMLNLYAKLQLEVDGHIGRVLDALESRPRVAANTVVVFTSDHGEYGGSHGLRGKGASAYEEAIRVPLIVKDPRGALTKAPEIARTQLTSSVDVAPLLLTIASGSDEWRRERRYAHIARRLDVAGILADPAAPGRPYVLHTTDETVTEFAVAPYAADAPLHVVALRTAAAKYATYSNWSGEGIRPLAEGQERELYDYRTGDGRLELDNGAGRSPLEETLQAMLQRAYAEELHRPLPPHLLAARERGFYDYFTVATRIATRAAAHRAERELAARSRLDRGRASDNGAGRVQRLHG